MKAASPNVLPDWLNDVVWFFLFMTKLADVLPGFQFPFPGCSAVSWHVPAVTMLTVPHVERGPTGNEQQLRVFAASLHFRVRPRQWRLEIVRHVFVELLILLLADFGLRSHP